MVWVLQKGRLGRCASAVALQESMGRLDRDHHGWQFNPIETKSYKVRVSRRRVYARYGIQGFSWSHDGSHDDDHDPAGRHHWDGPRETFSLDASRMTAQKAVGPAGPRDDEEMAPRSSSDDSSSFDSDESFDSSIDDDDDHPVSAVAKENPPTQVIRTPGNDSTLLVVTGASRGFGKAAAKMFCREFRVTTAILVARSADQLHEAGKILKAMSPQTQLVHHAMDLNLLDDLDGLLDMLFLHMYGCQRYGRIVFVNNAGSLGHLGPCTDTPSLQDMRQALDLNVSSCLWVSVRFARFLRDQGVHPPATLVNVSSLVALEPFPTMGVYSAGKAARDRYHEVLALENPNLRVLNYAPGPLETAMTQEIRECPTLDASLRPHYAKTLLDPEDSALTLVRLVREDTFRSGQHVDYYDENPSTVSCAST